MPRPDPNKYATAESRSKGGFRRAAKLREAQKQASAIAEELLREEVRARVERIADTIRIAEAVRIRYGEQLVSEDYEVRGSDVAALARIEALLEVEATERVIVAEVKEALRELRDVALRYIPPEAQEAFLQEFGGSSIET